MIMRSPFSSENPNPILFGMPRFATMFFYTALVTLTLPLVVVEKAGEHVKGLHLGLVTGGAALLSVGILYLFGMYRDRECRALQGASYPLYGLALSIPALAVIAFLEHYGILVLAFSVLIISRSFCEASHLSVLTDRPDLSDRGNYTAGITFWHFLGTGLGALSFGFMPELGSLFGLRLSSGLGAVSAAIVLAAMIGFHTVFYGPGNKRRDAAGEQRAGRLRLEIPESLRCLILARFFLLSGVLIISTFLVYVVIDYIDAAEARKTASLLYFWSIVGAIISSVPAGKLMRLKGEIPVIFVSGITLASVTAVFFLFGPDHPAINIPCMVLYGAGFAGIISAGLSLTVKLIPHPRMSGRIMAIITSSTFLAQALASVSGALLLDPLNRIQENLGYFGLFGITEIYFLLGGIFLYRIKKVLAEQP